MLARKESDIIAFPRFEEVDAEMAYIYLFQIDISGKMQKFFLGDTDKISDGLQSD